MEYDSISRDVYIHIRYKVTVSMTNQGTCFIESPLLFLVQSPHHLKLLKMVWGLD